MSHKRPNRPNSKAKRAWRAQLWTKQDGICALCNDPMQWNAHEHSEDYPTLDRIKSGMEGGKYNIANLQLAHRVCNEWRGKEDLRKKQDGPFRPRRWHSCEDKPLTVQSYVNGEWLDDTD